MQFGDSNNCPTREQLDKIQTGCVLSGDRFDLPTEFRVPVKGEYFITNDLNAWISYCNYEKWSGERWILPLKKQTPDYPCLKKYTFTNGRVWVILFTAKNTGMLVYETPDISSGYKIGEYGDNWGEKDYTLLPSNEKVILSN